MMVVMVVVGWQREQGISSKEYVEWSEKATFEFMSQHLDKGHFP